MWLFVIFDLPVGTAKERKIATKFRKFLLTDGFNMLQFSVYCRHCASDESTQVHVRRIKKQVPASGHISIMKITDKQYGDIINFWGKKIQNLPAGPAQLELF